MTHATVSSATDARRFPFIDEEGRARYLSTPDAIPALLREKHFDQLARAYAQTPNAESWYVRHDRRRPQVSSLGETRLILAPPDGGRRPSSYEDLSQVLRPRPLRPNRRG